MYVEFKFVQLLCICSEKFSRTQLYIYIYIYIYIYCHPQTDCFVAAQLFCEARHVGHFKLAYIYIYIYVCVCVCVRERERDFEFVQSNFMGHNFR